MKVVIDTNVLVSANLSDEGLPAAILDLAANKTILIFVSPAVLAEYEAVLRRPRLNLSAAAVARSLAVIRNIGRLVKPTRRLAIKRSGKTTRIL
jgi:putative PIN family toxin of toxin-antitoxin system